MFARNDENCEEYCRTPCQSNFVDSYATPMRMLSPSSWRQESCVDEVDQCSIVLCLSFSIMNSAGIKGLPRCGLGLQGGCMIDRP